MMMKGLAVLTPVLATRGPTRAAQIASLAVFQGTWFAAVFGAAQCVSLSSIVCVLCAVVWHLGMSERPTQEALLVGIACLIGFVVETVHGLLGYVGFPCAGGSLGLAPAWLVAMWGLFAICLNVTLRWLRSRWWLAAIVGAVGGPLSFASGVKLGAAYFVDPLPALVVIAATWSVVLPLMVWLSIRLDGISRVDQAP